MPLPTWLDKYPRAKALLQRKTERLRYAPDGDDLDLSSDARRPSNGYARLGGDTDEWSADLITLAGTMTVQEQHAIVRRLAEAVRQHEQDRLAHACGHPLPANPDAPCQFCGVVDP